LLPSQFFDRVRRRSEHDGDGRRLMIAVARGRVDVYRKQAGAQDAAPSSFPRAEE